MQFHQPAFAPTAPFLSANPHFSANQPFPAYTDDFVQLITEHAIAFHEKKLGQLFCDDSAQQIIDMLLSECRNAGAELRLNTEVGKIAAAVEDGYHVETSGGVIACIRWSSLQAAFDTEDWGDPFWL